MKLLRDLYGDVYLNTLLSGLFEFFAYLLIGLLGSITREIFVEKEKKISRIIGSSLLTAIILFATSSFIFKKFADDRMLFGVGALLGFYLPNFVNTISSGKIIKSIAKLFAPQLHKLIEDIEDEEKKL